MSGSSGQRRDELRGGVSPARQAIWEMIFESDDERGKIYDIVLMVVILLSVGALMLESVASIAGQWPGTLKVADWIFTVIFTIDYFVRLWCVRRKFRYVFSFFGIIDLLAWLPSYLVLLFGGGAFVGIVRVLRLLRVFRVFKMARHMGEASVLLTALRSSGAKITVFLFSVLAITLITGTMMYAIEGKHAIEGEQGFTSIPQAVYWSIVTITTVGYGDITPVTAAGKLIASALMVTAFAIIAVPTGIVTAEIQMEALKRRDQDGDGHLDILRCEKCGTVDHRQTAKFCYKCGDGLGVDAPEDE